MEREVIGETEYPFEEIRLELENGAMSVTMHQKQWDKIEQTFKTLKRELEDAKRAIATREMSNEILREAASERDAKLNKSHQLLRDALRGFESKIIKFEIYQNIREYLKSID